MSLEEEFANPSDEEIIRILHQRLQTAKEENEKLKEQYKWYDHYKDSALGHTKLINEKYIPEVEKLTQQNKQLKDSVVDIGAELINEQQQNKQMREALESIDGMYYSYSSGFNNIEKVLLACKKIVRECLKKMGE